jgi:anti-sigma-K factor RskA
MRVVEGASRRTRVRLPADVTRPFEVFVNGIPQVEGRDFRVEGRTLIFDRELVAEGRLGFWRWASIVLGIAGTYRRDDSVDVAYRRDGKPVVAAKLPLEPL